MAKVKQTYLNNPNLPAAEAEFEYTPEMAKEIKRCSGNILHFAEKYFYIVSLDEGKQTITLHNCQKRVLRKMRDNRFFILLASRQIGKALALDTKIPIPGGWTTIGELKTGDKVYGLNGKPCNVVTAHDVLYNRDCYRITFDNGEQIVADSEHEWYTETKSERRHTGSVKTTQQIFDTLYAGKEPNHRIPSCITGISGVRNNLPIDPYVLGVWLGDGNSDGATITVGKRDIVDMLDILQKQQSQFDKLTLHEYSTEVYTVRISTNEHVKTKSLSTLLGEHNLKNNKHIPEEYLYADRQQRLDLLQGLVDSDGYINKNGTCQFYNTNIELVKQTKRLVESLGYKVTYKEYTPKLYNIECSKAAVITFKPVEYVCRLSFKRSRIKVKPFTVQSKYRAQWHYIKNVEKVESVPVRCITVDTPDSLFLVGESYIPTHNTTLMTIFALHVACFQKDQSILIVANKEGTAIEIFRRIRLAYEELPNWLKPGVKEYGKTSMSLSNGCRIGISTTTGTAARGQSINVLLLDELAFIEMHLVDEFWKSVYPIVSSSKKSKIFIASTANGTGNLFHTLYTGAEEGTNGWAHDKILWNEIPGRDEKWKRETISTIGSIEAFSQEFNCLFLDAGESTVSEILYDKLKIYLREAPITMDEGKYQIWDQPNDESLYVAGVDTSEGVGKDASVVVILDITDLTCIKQVALYHSRTIPPARFTLKVHEILTQWGKPFACIERNNCGAQVVDNLRNNFNYENLVSWGAAAASRSKDQLGIISHTNTKFTAIQNMRYFMNQVEALQLRDAQTLKEFKDFVRQDNGTWAAKKGVGFNDDRVMAVIWALVVLDKALVEKLFEVIKYDDNHKPLIIKPLDFGIKYNTLPKSIYNDEENPNSAMPSLILGNEKTNETEYDQLLAQGFEVL